MRKLTQLIAATKRLMVVHFGYTVWSEEYNVTHYVWSWKEAIEWAQCYPEALIRSNDCFYVWKAE